MRLGSKRVLQHADAPRAILAEIRRVLRPGGRVVVYEPDWSSLAIDCDTPAVGDAVRRAVMLAARHPRVGLQLRRLLVEAGFRNVRCELDVAMVTSFERLGAVFNLDRALQRAVSERLVTEGEADRFRNELQERFRRHTFWATLNWTAAWASV